MDLKEKTSSHVLTTALLVEDEEVWGKVLSRYLASRGCDVTWLKNGSEVLPFILDVEPDLIMLDLKLPDMGGPALLESVARLGPETIARCAVVTSYPMVAKTWSADIRVIDKADLSELDGWIDEVLGAGTSRENEMISMG